MLMMLQWLLMVLQLFCEKLDVTDLEEVVPTLHKLTVTAEAYAHLEQVMSVLGSDMCSFELCNHCGFV